jgi:hypothetical protein
MSSDPTLPVAPELQALVDRAALIDLVSRLGRWLDDGATGDPAALFTDDVRVSTPGGEATGVAGIVAQAQRNHAVPTQHVITNVLPEIRGDSAQITANLVVTFVESATDLGRRGQTYTFDAVRTAAGWRLSSVTVRVIWRVG